MGDRGKGKDKGAAKKAPKAAKPGKRPHELRQQDANRKTPGVLDPPTCQHALRQARRLAKNLTGPPKPYGYRMLGQVATLGYHKGIAEIPGFKLRGFLGWWVARTYHLYQLPLLSRKLRVVTDWTVALVFPRDIGALSMLGHPRRLGE